MTTVSFNSIKKNTKLTDFEDIKDLVLRNSVKGVPIAEKTKCYAANLMLSEFV